MFKKMNWESSKRLMYGSILCLSLDGFTDNNLFAVIAERDAKNMAKGITAIILNRAPSNQG